MSRTVQRTYSHTRERRDPSGRTSEFQRRPSPGDRRVDFLPGTEPDLDVRSRYSLPASQIQLGGYNLSATPRRLALSPAASGLGRALGSVPWSTPSNRRLHHQEREVFVSDEGPRRASREERLMREPPAAGARDVGEAEGLITEASPRAMPKKDLKPLPSATTNPRSEYVEQGDPVPATEDHGPAMESDGHVDPRELVRGLTLEEGEYPLPVVEYFPGGDGEYPPRDVGEDFPREYRGPPGAGAYDPNDSDFGSLGGSQGSRRNRGPRRKNPPGGRRNGGPPDDDPNDPNDFGRSEGGSEGGSSPSEDENGRGIERVMKKCFEEEMRRRRDDSRKLKVKMKPPPQYSGGHQTFNNVLGWLSLMINFLRGSREHPRNWIQATNSYLTGTAQRTVANSPFRYGDGNWSAYKQFLVYHFLDETHEQDLREIRNNLTQGRKTLSEYSRYWERLELEYSRMKMHIDPSDWAYAFIRGLADRTDRHYIMLSRPKTMNEVISLAKLLQAAKGKEEKSKNNYYRTRYRNPTSEESQENHHISDSSGDEECSVVITDLKAGSVGPLTPELKKHRLKNGLCLACGGPGHAGKGCEAIKKLKYVANTEAELQVVKMKKAPRKGGTSRPPGGRVPVARQLSAKKEKLLQALVGDSEEEEEEDLDQIEEEEEEANHLDPGEEEYSDTEDLIMAIREARQAAKRSNSARPSKDGARTKNGERRLQG